MGRFTDEEGSINAQYKSAILLLSGIVVSSGVKEIKSTKKGTANSFEVLKSLLVPDKTQIHLEGETLILRSEYVDIDFHIKFTSALTPLNKFTLNKFDNEIIIKSEDSKGIYIIITVNGIEEGDYCSVSGIKKVNIRYKNRVIASPAVANSPKLFESVKDGLYLLEFGNDKYLYLQLEGNVNCDGEYSKVDAVEERIKSTDGVIQETFTNLIACVKGEEVAKSRVLNIFGTYDLASKGETKWEDL